MSQPGNNTLQRRRYLVTVGAVVGSVGLAGCTGSEIGLSDSGTDSQTPEEFAERYMNALDQGDHQKIQDLTHSEGDTPSAEDIAEWGASTFEISQISVQTQTEERATVQVVSVFETGAGANAVTDELQLRKENGNWRAYSGERIPSDEEIQDEIERIQSEIEGRQEEINDRQNEINELQTEIENRRESGEGEDDIPQIRSEITQHRDEISSLEDEISQRETEIENLREQLDNKE